ADDYRGLERTVRLAEQPAYWSFDWSRTALLTIDAQRRIAPRPLAGTAAEAAPVPVPITALEHSPITREIRVDDDGSAGAFALTVAVPHPARNELELMLTAQSGAA